MVDTDILKISEDGKVVLDVYDNSVMSVEIPDGVEIIGEKAFSACNLLREVIMPQSVRIIKEDAFSCCKYLSTIKLSDNLVEIGDYRGEKLCIPYICFLLAVLV